MCHALVDVATRQEYLKASDDAKYDTKRENGGIDGLEEQGS